MASTRMRKKPVAERPQDDGWNEHRRKVGNGTLVEHTRRVGLFDLLIEEPTRGDDGAYTDERPLVSWMVMFERGNTIVMGEFQPSAWAVDAAKREAMAALGHGLTGTGPDADAAAGLSLLSPYRLLASDIDAIADRVIAKLDART